MQHIQLATFGIWELVLILTIALVIFGANKLPMVGEAMGKGIRNFRKSYKDESKENKDEIQHIDENQG